jgi:hypothetical protein
VVIYLENLQAVKQLARTETVAGSQEVTNKAIITGMLVSAVKEIAGVLHCIFPAYGSTSATLPLGIEH